MFKEIINKYTALPPYNFTYNITKRITELSKGTENIINIKNRKMFDSFSNLIYNIVSKDSNEYLRLIKIDDILLKLIETTDNEIFYRPLITPTMFIDNEIIYEDLTIKGITILDVEFYDELFSQAEKDASLGTIIHKDNYFIFFYIWSKDNITFDFFTLDNNITSSNNKLKNYIRNFICNTLDMISLMDDKLNIVTIETTKEHNEKRIKRGQIPNPTKIFIHSKDEFRIYIDKFLNDLDEGIRKIGHKFLVRGHWRHFRAERYKNKTKKDMVWIKPFWKGEGIPISKEYILKN